jgi:hypothetical protein
MSELKVIPRKRNVAIGLSVPVLFLSIIGCYYVLSKEPPPTSAEEFVNAIQEPVKLPQEFEKTLPAGVKGLILVSEGKNKDDDPIVTAIDLTGTPINLCGSISKTRCKVDTTGNALVLAVVNTGASGFCESGTFSRQCHMDGPHKDRWYYHRKDPDKYKHSDCPDGCAR